MRKSGVGLVAIHGQLHASCNTQVWKLIINKRAILLQITDWLTTACCLLNTFRMFYRSECETLFIPAPLKASRYLLDKQHLKQQKPLPLVIQFWFYEDEYRFGVSDINFAPPQHKENANKCSTQLHSFLLKI